MTEEPLATTGLPDRGNRLWILAAVGLGSLVGGIDASITNTVLPFIEQDFHASITTISWVLMAYLLTLSATLLTAGRVGDLVGHRRVFLLGFVVFGLSSAVCGAAPSELVLIGFRAVQACGGAMMASTSFVLIGQAYGSKERGRGIGLLIAITYFGLSVGPALGGFLASSFSWRAVFYVNVPICVVGLALGWRILPRDTGVTAHVGFDVLGAAASVAALSGLLIALSEGQTWGWKSAGTLTSLFVAIVAAGLFIPLELTRLEPMLDLRLFRDRLFSFATGSAMLNYAGNFFQALLLPFYFLQLRAFTLDETGLLLVVTPVFMMLLSPLSGRVSDRIGSRLPSTAGMLFCSAALVGFAMFNARSPIPQIMVTEVVMGIGTGLFTSPNTSTIMGSVPPDRQGTAAGMQAVARNVGMVIGIAMAGAIFSARLAALGGAGNFVPAYRDTLLVGAAVMFAGAILSSRRGSSVSTGRSEAARSTVRA